MTTVRAEKQCNTRTLGAELGAAGVRYTGITSTPTATEVTCEESDAAAVADAIDAHVYLPLELKRNRRR
jgi:enoyl-[acyl-carrier-protein] reductase (NADH)